VVKRVVTPMFTSFLRKSAFYIFRALRQQFPPKLHNHIPDCKCVSDFRWKQTPGVVQVMRSLMNLIIMLVPLLHHNIMLTFTAVKKLKLNSNQRLVWVVRCKFSDEKFTETRTQCTIQHTHTHTPVNKSLPQNTHLLFTLHCAL
jgi:hypothetical protein